MIFKEETIKKVPRKLRFWLCFEGDLRSSGGLVGETEQNFVCVEDWCFVVELKP